MILLDNEYIRVEYNEEHSYMCSVWKKYTPSAAYREIVILSYELTVDKQVCKGLADLRLLPTISAEDSYWTVEISKHYYPHICRANIFKSAVILSEGALLRLTLNSMNNEFKATHQDVETRIITRYFGNEEEARQWLLDMEG